MADSIKRVNGRWAKGQSGNPHGQPPHRELQAIRRLTRDQVAEIGSMLVRGEIDELKKVRDNERESALRRTLAKAVIKAFDEGDMVKLELILVRVIGKPKDDVEITHVSGPKVLVMLPPNVRDTKTIEAELVPQQPPLLENGNQLATDIGVLDLSGDQAKATPDDK